MEMQHAGKMHSTPKSNSMSDMQYQKLAWMVIISFIAMFILMYSMVDQFANVVINVNRFF